MADLHCPNCGEYAYGVLYVCNTCGKMWCNSCEKNGKRQPGTCCPRCYSMEYHTIHTMEEAFEQMKKTQQ